MSEQVDCVIVGGGPAGATAGIYLARFRRSVVVVDEGYSRATWIPTSHNHAGNPEGVNGRDLVERMQAQAQGFGATFRKARVDAVEAAGDGFVAQCGDERIAARSILFATGVENRRPAMDGETHTRALQRGVLRYCPICDGYEVIDKRIGVIGADGHGVDEAMFLRTYSEHVTVFALQHSDLSLESRETLGRVGIAVEEHPIADIAFGDEDVRLTIADRAEPVVVDTIYPALGSDSNNALAKAMGLELSGGQCIVVDEHQRSSMAGVYAAGDIVFGLDQISVAMGQAAVAATAIHNDLRQRDGMTAHD